MADRILTVAQARKLIFGALTGAGATAANSRYFTEAILDTEMSGIRSIASIFYPARWMARPSRK
jgi:LDH2 family malate/lactate/ureidoglycolate dehydrogenase